MDGTVNKHIAEWILEIINNSNIQQTFVKKVMFFNVLRSVLIDTPKSILRKFGLINKISFYSHTRYYILRLLKSENDKI